MTFHPLEGAFARVSRAEEHLRDLDDMLASILNAQQNSIPIEFDINSGYVVPQRPKGTFVTYEVAILIGEICYNLRDALDYLIYELTRADSGSVKSGTQFLIEDLPENFIRRQKTFLNGLNTAHIAAIERLQPYNGCDWAAALRDFSNRDKHREFVGIGGTSVIQFWPEWDSSFENTRVPIRRAKHARLGEVNVKVHFRGEITFEDGSSIIQMLEKIKAQVAATLTQFKFEFGAAT
jgi:hypothetical protein